MLFGKMNVGSSFDTLFPGAARAGAFPGLFGRALDLAGTGSEVTLMNIRPGGTSVTPRQSSDWTFDPGRSFLDYTFRAPTFEGAIFDALASIRSAPTADEKFNGIMGAIGLMRGDRKPEPPAMVSTRLEGDALRGLLSTPNGRITFDRSDKGFGIGDDEIGGNEVMTLKAPPGANGGILQLEDLFANRREQEQASIRIFRKDGTFEDKLVSGTRDGRATVGIDGEWDRIEMRGVGRQSDFSVAALTTSAPADTPPGTEAAGDTPFAPLLTGLEMVSRLVRDSESPEREQLLNDIARVLRAIAEATDPAGARGEELSRFEQREIIGLLAILIPAINKSISGDSPEKRAAYDQIGKGLEVFADET